jgi:hypothetical protein
VSNAQISKDQIERMQACTNAQEVMAILSEDGFELTDDQLEAVVGGTAASWSVDELLQSFGNLLQDLFPDDFDPKEVWSNLPTGTTH